MSLGDVVGILLGVLFELLFLSTVAMLIIGLLPAEKSSYMVPPKRGAARRAERGKGQGAHMHTTTACAKPGCLVMYPHGHHCPDCGPGVYAMVDGDGVSVAEVVIPPPQGVTNA